jgi:hypothetical protein
MKRITTAKRMQTTNHHSGEISKAINGTAAIRVLIPQPVDLRKRKAAPRAKGIAKNAATFKWPILSSTNGEREMAIATDKVRGANRRETLRLRRKYVIETPLNAAMAASVQTTAAELLNPAILPKNQNKAVIKNPDCG